MNIRDVQNAGVTLEPLVCLNPDCEKPETENHCVDYNQYIGDAVCSWCGEWQEQYADT